MPKLRRAELAVGAGGGQLAELELLEIAQGPWPGWPTMPGEATFAVPREMPLALNLLLLPLSVLLKLTVLALLRGLGAVTACS